jgi:phenylacetate-CoA ligase
MNLPALTYRAVRPAVRFAPKSRVLSQIRTASHQTHLGFLSALLGHARHQVPYYASAAPVSAQALTELAGFPVLTKAVLRTEPERLQSTDLPTRRWWKNSSGGSSGEPTTFIQDQEFLNWRVATEAFYYAEFLGHEFNVTRTVILWGSERDLFSRLSRKGRLWNWATQATLLNAFRMTPADMLRYVDTINRKRPLIVRGYAGSLYELARFVKARGLRLAAPRVVYSSAEMLTPSRRETIEEVFQAPVFDFYGSREVGAIAGQCRRGALHLFTFNNWVEVVDDRQRPIQPGQQGRLLVTTLHNYAMPLIRYDIGDTAVLGEPCPCSPLPTLARLTGRVTDHFLTRDGALVHGEYFTHLFYFRDWVREFQVLQTDVDAITVYVAAHRTPSAEDLADITGKIRFIMGGGCQVQWEHVDHVPRTPQGKLLFTRSLLGADSEGRRLQA